MDCNQKAIAHNFSEAAHSYDSSQKANDLVTERLSCLLPETASHIYEIACGTGLMTQRLRKRYPKARITAIDIAPKMIDYCKNRFKNDPLMHFELCSAEDYIPQKKADLIVSTSSFQWFSDKRAAVQNMLSSIAQGGRIAIAMGYDGLLQELYSSYEMVTQEPLYVTDLWEGAHCAEKLTELGLPLERLILDSYRIDEPCVWSLLRSLHGIGALTPRAKLTPGQLRQLERTYRKHFSSKTGIRVTYRTCYAISEEIYR